MKNFFNKIIDWFKNIFDKIINWFEGCDELNTIVTYSVKEYTTYKYNVLGEKINSKTRYFICKTIILDNGGFDVDTVELSLYIEKKQLDNCKLVRWTHGRTSVNRTYFDKKEDAEKTLNDILTNPNTYIIK